MWGYSLVLVFSPPTISGVVASQFEIAMGWDDPPKDSGFTNTFSWVRSAYFSHSVRCGKNVRKGGLLIFYYNSLSTLILFFELNDVCWFQEFCGCSSHDGWVCWPHDGCVCWVTEGLCSWITEGRCCWMTEGRGCWLQAGWFCCWLQDDPVDPPDFGQQMMVWPLR